MRQEEGSKPSCCGKLAEPVKYWIEDRIEEKSKRADHNHNFESNNEEQQYARKGRKLGCLIS